MSGVNSVSNTTDLIKVGPGGWPNNNGDSNWDLKGISKITRIFISSSEDYISSRIRSIQFQYIINGETKLSPVFGNNSNHTGFNFDMVVFSEGNDEYITRLSGAARKGYDNRITCLTIETNLKKYGPFGCVEDGENTFRFRFGPGNHFAGFFGTSSSSDISSIGCYVSPYSTTGGVRGGPAGIPAAYRM